MATTKKLDEQIAKMSFASVYPHYVTKVEKKGRSLDELQQVIEWLTGYNKEQLQEIIDSNIKFETFFKEAKHNPNAHLIKGVICGYRIEEIAAMKLELIANGGRKKDFWDLLELFNTFSLNKMLYFYKKRYPYGFSKQEILYQLTNFENAEDDFLPICLLGKTGI